MGPKPTPESQRPLGAEFEPGGRLAAGASAAGMTKSTGKYKARAKYGASPRPAISSTPPVIRKGAKIKPMPKYHATKPKTPSKGGAKSLGPG